MKSKVAVVAISVACFSYLVIASLRASQFSETNSGMALFLALAIVAVVAISALLIAREILFGLHISQMSTVLEAENLLLPDDLPRTASGQTEKEAADNRFELIAKEVEANPDSWQSWFRIAVAYDESRDRKRARECMRKAERLFLKSKSR